MPEGMEKGTSNDVWLTSDENMVKETLHHSHKKSKANKRERVYENKEK